MDTLKIEFPESILVPMGQTREGFLEEVPSGGEALRAGATLVRACRRDVWHGSSKP